MSLKQLKEAIPTINKLVLKFKFFVQKTCIYVLRHQNLPSTLLMALNWRNPNDHIIRRISRSYGTRRFAPHHERDFLDPFALRNERSECLVGCERFLNLTILLFSSLEYKKQASAKTKRTSKNFFARTIIYVITLIFVIGLQAKTPTIMLSPSGDASDKGRSLSDGFERGATRQLAEAIKKELEAETDTRIILTHNAGEHITQEQKANFANRLNVDIYIALTITPDDHLSISPYYYKAEPFTPSMPQRLTFYPVKKAYLRSIEQTQKYIKNSLIPQAYQTMFDIFKPIGLPIKLLEGILAPAFVFEIGIKKTGDILTYVEPLSKAISKMIGDDNDNNKA